MPPSLPPPLVPCPGARREGGGAARLVCLCPLSIHPPTAVSRLTRGAGLLVSPRSSVFFFRRDAPEHFGAGAVLGGVQGDGAARADGRAGGGAPGGPGAYVFPLLPPSSLASFLASLLVREKKGGFNRVVARACVCPCVFLWLSLVLGFVMLVLPSSSSPPFPSVHETARAPHTAAGGLRCRHGRGGLPHQGHPVPGRGDRRHGGRRRRRGAPNAPGVGRHHRHPVRAGGAPVVDAD